MNKNVIKIIMFFIITSFLFTACKKNTEYIEEDFFIPSLYGEGVCNLEHQEITIYFRQYGGWTIPDNVMDSLNIKCKNEINTTLNFKYIPIYNDDKKIGYFDAIKEKIMAGETFDAFYLNGVSHAFPFLYDGELLLDISQLFPEYAPVLYQKYDEDVLEEACYKDDNGNKRMFFIPAVAPNTNRPYLLVNAENMGKYGYKDINTLEKLEEYLDTVKTDKGKVTVFLDDYNFLNIIAAMDYFCLIYDYERFRYDVAGFNEPTVSTYFVKKFYEPISKITAFEQTKEFVYFINLINRFKEKGYIKNEVNLVTSSKIYDAYLGYKEAIDNMQNYNTNTIYNMFELYPDSKIEKASLNSANDRRHGLVFNKYAKNPERTLIFLEWLQLKQDNYDLLMYGVKDTDYSLDENGQINYLNKNFHTLQWIAYGRKAFLNPEYMRTTYLQPKDLYEKLYDGIKKGISESSYKGLETDYAYVQTYEQDFNKRNIAMLQFFEMLKTNDVISNIELSHFISEQSELAEKLQQYYQKMIDEWAK